MIIFQNEEFVVEKRIVSTIKRDRERENQIEQKRLYRDGDDHLCVYVCLCSFNEMPIFKIML